MNDMELIETREQIEHCVNWLESKGQSDLTEPPDVLIERQGNLEK